MYVCMYIYIYIYISINVVLQVNLYVKCINKLDIQPTYGLTHGSGCYMHPMLGEQGANGTLKTT
jgi:hypothetical protein